MQSAGEGTGHAWSSTPPWAPPQAAPRPWRVGRCSSAARDFRFPPRPVAGAASSAREATRPHAVLVPTAVAICAWAGGPRCVLSGGKWKRGNVDVVIRRVRASFKLGRIRSGAGGTVWTGRGEP